MNSVERVKAICKSRKIPISKLEKDLGYANGYIGQLRKGVFPANRLSEIANYLSVSLEYLMTGEEQKKAPALTERDRRDIAKEVEIIMSDLEKGGDLMFDGVPMSQEAIESLSAAMKLGLEAAKLKNKETYTPKKYRKK